MKRGLRLSALPTLTEFAPGPAGCPAPSVLAAELPKAAALGIARPRRHPGEGV